MAAAWLMTGARASLLADVEDMYRIGFIQVCAPVQFSSPLQLLQHDPAEVKQLASALLLLFVLLNVECGREEW
jgi:hypothetical protein